MSLGAGIFEFLSEAGLVVDDRIYPLTLPQGVSLPAITHQLVSDTPLPTHSWAQDHPSYDGRKYKEARVQFNAYGTTFDEAEAVANELEAAITGYRGLWGDVQIESVLPALSLDDYDVDTKSWRRISDYFIAWLGGPDGS